MSKSWTTEQNQAINASGGCVLVAAAAGSGKTSVLTERVIKKITNSHNPVDIDRFLIVTFTKAAAEEMKNRISARLSQLISENPQDANLLRQKMLLQSAGIGTIHSFCSSLVKENFFKLGVSPKFRIAKDSELKTIESEAMETTLEKFFSEMTPQKKITADLFTSEKDDHTLSDIIKIVYEITKSLPFPKLWMSKTLKMYEFTNNKNSVWQEFVINHTKEICEDLLKVLERMTAAMHSDIILEKKYAALIDADSEIINSILMSAETADFSKTADAFENMSFKRFTCIKENPPYDMTIIQNCHAYIKETLQKNLKPLFEFENENTKNAAEYMRTVFGVIFDAVNYYDEQINSLKLFKNVLEFSDLERKTIELLTDEDENGNFLKSEFANEISENFEEIMIDEYQDVNELQDTIFKMISRNEENIFVVGDVKQSIYKFRQSRPEIFLRKKTLFPVYSPEMPSFPAKILLGKNFRSDSKIIDGINFIFKKLMSEKAGEIEYNSEEELTAGAEYSPQKQNNISVKIIKAEKENQYRTEATEIAKMILELISSEYKIESGGNMRTVGFSDFCILLRSHKSCAHIYCETLQECGIPALAEINDKFLETEEISTITSLLETINNPALDIPLTATLLSPFFGFTMDKIAEICSINTKIPLYFALEKFYEENPNDQEIQKFITELKYYRNLAASYPCDEIIEAIYERTAYPSVCLAAPDGYRKRANLIKFSEYARNFEKDNHSGISGFLNFINGIKNRGEDLKPAEISEGNECAVKIMSVHKSKGLEFPICILANCSSKFGSDKNSILINHTLGIGTKTKNSDATLSYDNVIRKAISIKNKKENISEEMRILYVALTRAKQKLILTATLENPEKYIADSLSVAPYFKSVLPSMIYKSNSFLEWILMAISQSALYEDICAKSGIDSVCGCTPEKPDFNWNFEIINPENENANLVSDDNADIQKMNFTYDEKLLELFQKRLDFQYPYEDLVNLPMKISASQIVHGETSQDYVASSKPEFMFSKKLTPMHRGTAMHHFVCYADFSSITSETAQNECRKLLSGGFLTTEEYESLDIPAIKRFVSSEIFDRISKSAKILKEHRFSVNFPAYKINPEIKSKNTLIVVQGAIDCAFEENSEYVIIDYKTDKAHDIHELYKKYEKQLLIYKYALEQTENIKVKELGIYSFSLNKYFSPSTAD